MRFFGKTRTIAPSGRCRHSSPNSVLLPLLAVVSLASFSQAAQTTENASPDERDLLARAADQLLALPAADIKLRQKARLFGQEVTGSGTYLQKQSPRGLLLRLDLKLQVGDQMSSLQQVCDGRFLWIRRDAANTVSVGRVDLERIRDAIRSSGRTSWVDASSNWLAVGGLAQLLAALGESFQFSAPQAVRTDKASLWVVDGRWKPARLAELLPNQRDAILAGQAADPARLPPQLPTDVRVVLGQSDLMPYRIEYRRAVPSGNTPPPEAAQTEPNVVLEILAIRRPQDLDPGLFAYEPGNQEVTDYTDLYVQALNLTPRAESKRE